MRNVVLMLMAAVLLGGCRSSEAPQAETNGAPWSLITRAAGTPAALSTAQPQLTVSDRGPVILSWIETTGEGYSLQFAEKTATGWSPKKTAASGDDWFVSWAEVPMVLRLSNGTLVANYLRQSNPDLEAYDLWLTYSTDGGSSWSKPFTPHHDGTQTQHGFASLFETPDRGLGVVWLDGRAMKLGIPGTDPGPMGVRFASFDAGWKQTAELPVAPRVCECCSTAAAITADGVLAAFRNRSDTEIRDVYVSRLQDKAWTSPTPVHADNWQITGCPINGPALSASGRTVAVAWFTAKTDKGQAYAAFSNDAGKSWGAPIRLDDEVSQGRVDIELLDDGSAVATWVEYTAEGEEFRARRIEASGARSPSQIVAKMGKTMAREQPRVARSGGELVFAWTGNDTGEQQIHTAVASIPVSSGH